MVKKGGEDLEVTNKILSDVREAVGLGEEPDSFNPELLMHINANMSKLNQNGIGLPIVVDPNTTWLDFLDPMQIVGNLSSNMIPLYVMLSTKIIFDPPPPSSVDLQSRNADELLWRLKVAYETGGENNERTR